MKVRRLVALLAVTALAAAGCGSDSAAPSKDAKATRTPAKEKQPAPSGY